MGVLHPIAMAIVLVLVRADGSRRSDPAAAAYVP
jgi:hypothetical protein